MNYPLPPWDLKGYAIQTLNFIDIDKARSLIPRELEIVSVLPGKTIGGIYLSSYESGSLLQYNELIVFAGLTRHKNKIGSWISHVYVDSETSVAGGREIWGLPKEMAEFSWERERITLYRGDRTLCNLAYRSSWLNLATWWQPQFGAAAFGKRERDLLTFTNQFAADIILLESKVTVPQNSPFASLDLERPLFTLKLKQLNLRAGVPEVVTKTSAPTAR